jgi:hypothetical protein
VRIPENTACRVNSRLRRLRATDRMRRESWLHPSSAATAARTIQDIWLRITK